MMVSNAFVTWILKDKLCKDIIKEHILPYHRWNNWGKPIITLEGFDYDFIIGSKKCYCQIVEEELNWNEHQCLLTSDTVPDDVWWNHSCLLVTHLEKLDP